MIVLSYFIFNGQKGFCFGDMEKRSKEHFNTYSNFCLSAALQIQKYSEKVLFFKYTMCFKIKDMLTDTFLDTFSFNFN